MTSKSVLVFTLLYLAFSNWSCYTLNGVSISTDTQTFYVEQFDVNATDSPQELGQVFSEILKQKINTNSRLAFDDVNPDVVFAGAVVEFVVTPEAANANNQADLNRLSVRVSVDYVDSKTEKNSYTQTFSDFEVFDGGQNFLEIEDDLTAILFDRIAEDAFNKAFSNW